MSDEKVRDRSPVERKERRGGGDRRKSGAGGGGKGASRRAPPERRIFLSNIPFEMKWQEVKDMFREQVGDVTYVELFNDEHDKPRGCGILEFATEELAKLAVDKMHRYEFRGRKLVVKEDFDTERDKYGRILPGRNRGGDRGDRSDRDRMGSNSNFGPSMGNTYGLSLQFLDSLGIDGPLHNRLFVANLAYSVDEKKLREVFRLAGRVVMAELNRDKDGKSRGHAVVEFDHPVEAVQAISMFNNQMLFDRKMTVRFDKQPGPTPEELSQLPSRLPEGLDGVGMGLGSGGNPLTDVAKNLPGSSGNSNQQIGQMGNMNQMGGGGGNMDDGGGVPQGLSELSSLVMLAKQLGNGNGSVLANALSGLSGGGGTGGNPNQGVQRTMSNTGMGMSGGSGMGNPGMGMNMGMNNSSMGPIGGLMSGQPNMGGGSSSSSMPDVPRNTGYSTSGSGGYGGSGQGDMSDMMGGPNRGPSTMRSDTVMIRNLPADCNWQILREGFAHCGEIKYAEMKDRGTGMIRFINERDAERAVSMMNNQSIAGRTIDVRLY